MKPIITLLFAALLFSACDDKDDKNVTVEDFSSVDSLRMSHTPQGQGASFITVFFKIKDGKVWQGTNTSNLTSWPTSFIELRNDRYEKTKHLLTEVPNELANQTNKYYNSPIQKHCGGTTVTAYKEGKSYVWSFSNCTEDVDESVRPYADKVRTAIQVYLSK